MEGDEDLEYTYDEKFEGNIFIVGRTAKQTFIQKLGKKLFGDDITDVFRVSKNILTKEREDFIRDSFEDQEIHFIYLHNLDDFNYPVGNFMQDNWQWTRRTIGSN